mmetsp:Transcript_8096/g.14406  ORF Transcript_8096/g.14406 Transcript_8096/m.14406 type:complete len:216 (+) Transcript_8096:209-856(+)
MAVFLFPCAKRGKRRGQAAKKHVARQDANLVSAQLGGSRACGYGTPAGQLACSLAQTNLACIAHGSATTTLITSTIATHATAIRTATAISHGSCALLPFSGGAYIQTRTATDIAHPISSQLVRVWRFASHLPNSSQRGNRYAPPNRQRWRILQLGQVHAVGPFLAQSIQQAFLDQTGRRDANQVGRETRAQELGSHGGTPYIASQWLPTARAMVV